MFLLKLSLRGWRQAPFSQIFSSLSLGVLVFLAGFIWFARGQFAPLHDAIQSEKIYLAYLLPERKHKKEFIVDQISESVGSSAIQLSEVKFVEREAFVRELEKNEPLLKKQIASLPGEIDVLIPEYVLVKGTFREPVGEVISQIDDVEKVVSADGELEPILFSLRTLNWFLGMLSIGILIALLTALIQVSKMNSTYLKSSLLVLKQWGLNEFLLKAPSILAMTMIGVLGGAIAAGMWLVLSVRFGDSLQNMMSAYGVVSQPSPMIAVYLATVSIVASIAAGILGQFFAGHRPSPRAQTD